MASLEQSRMYQLQQTLPITPFEPFNPFAASYAMNFLPRGFYAPYENTGWRDETCSWKTTCYIHTQLVIDTLKLSGPDTIKLIERACCSNFNNFETGRIKHAILVNEEGLVASDGVIFRTAEDEVITFGLVPALPYVLDCGKYGSFDVKKEYLTGNVFLFQVAGPTSINTLEAAADTSLRDISHLRFCDAAIAGKEVRIARVGMAGTLAYEVHGNADDALAVYDAIWQAGQDFGIRKLGSRSYPMNHAENGFPQYGVHFQTPHDREIMEYVLDPSVEGVDLTRAWITMGSEAMAFSGSAGDDFRNYVHNPYELGWGGAIKFDHDFIGRAALEKICAQDKRHIVTLEWNVDDIADVWASQFRDEEPYKFIDEPTDFSFLSGAHRDYVLDADGNMLGLSFGRQNSAYFHRMISICCLDTEFAQLGTEVYVLWGDVGKRQKKIRAAVVRYPYNNVLRSSETDVNSSMASRKSSRPFFVLAALQEAVTPLCVSLISRHSKNGSPYDV